MTLTGLKTAVVSASLAIFGAASVATAQTSDDALQIVPLQEAPGQASVVFAGPYMNAGLIQLLRSHTSHSDWRTSDNMLFPRTMLYDALHKRLMVPGIQLGDVNNPANLKLGRIPTDAKDEPDINARHTPGTIVGQICSLGWGRKGFTACQAALQFITFDEETGGLCLSLETGKDGATPPYPGWPNGIPFTRQDLVCHVLVYPDGHLVVGVNTDPRQRPRYSLVVNGNGELNGNVVINGDLTVNGAIYASRFVPAQDPKSTK
jgi:hypothetical protein